MGEEEKKDLAQTINRMVAKTLNRYLAGLIVIFIAIFGWHEIELKANSKRINELSEKSNQGSRELNDLQSDFGYSCMYLNSQFPNAIVFQSNFEKYVQKRGIAK